MNITNAHARTDISHATTDDKTWKKTKIKGRWRAEHGKNGECLPNLDVRNVRLCVCVLFFATRKERRILWPFARSRSQAHYTMFVYIHFNDCILQFHSIITLFFCMKWDIFFIYPWFGCLLCWPAFFTAPLSHFGGVSLFRALTHHVQFQLSIIGRTNILNAKKIVWVYAKNQLGEAVCTKMRACPIKLIIIIHNPPSVYYSPSMCDINEATVADRN